MKPTIIAGPAIIQHNGQTYYTEGDITLNLNRETFNVVTALAGTIDERLVSQLVEIRFKPVGALDVVAKYLPYAATQIGSLLIDQTTPKSVVIWAKDGVKTTWANGFVSALPSFTLSPTATAIGEMTITVLDDPTEEPTDAAAWNAITSAALADTSFDETKILTPRYTAEWGSFADIESEAGFTFEPVMSISPKRVANYGNVNFMLTDLVVGARFVPTNLTEAEIWQLLRLQDSGALLPGQSLGSTDDLVISGGGVSFTLAQCGPKTAVTQYGLEPLRQGEVVFVSRKKWTAGTLQALFTIAFS